MNNIDLKLLGTIDYKEAWDYQEQLFAELVSHKLQQTDSEQKNYLILCEHPHVFTLGKSGSDKNLLATESWLKMAGATFYKINRGGDITYHGPGQIVGYPIIDLECFSMGIHRYIECLEEVIIRTVAHYGLQATRLAGATGVWLDVDSNPRKLCAIGVRASRYITMHGFALNISSDLSYFQKIIPCGIPDKKVTSLENELSQTIALEEVQQIILKEFASVFACCIRK